MYTVPHRLAAVLIAGVTCLALGVCATTLDGRAGSSAAFLLFLVTLPWTLSIYVLTMVFNITAPIAIDITLVLVTIAVWWAGSQLLMRTCVSPREP